MRVYGGLARHPGEPHAVYSMAGRLAVLLRLRR
jgi:hypothetical protein